MFVRVAGSRVEISRRGPQLDVFVCRDQCEKEDVSKKCKRDLRCASGMSSLSERAQGQHRIAKWRVSKRTARTSSLRDARASPSFA